MMPGNAGPLQLGFSHLRHRGNGAFILVIVLLPWILLVADIGWPFNDLGQADAYYFSGFFRDYPLLAANAPERNLGYETSRLPWILPGYGLYSLFGPQAANIVLKLLVFYATVFAFYVVASRFFGYLFAFAGAVLLCTDGVFLRWIGSDYVSAPVICYSLVSLALFTQYWRVRTNDSYLVLGGFFAACAVASHLFAAPIILIIVMFHWVHALGEPVARGPGAARLYAYPIIGAMAALIFLGLVNGALGRPFLFFVPQFSAVPAKSAVLNSWRQQGHEWMSYADWLILPLFVFVYSAGILARRIARRGSETRGYVFSLLAAALVLMYFAGNLIGIYFFVERDYYAAFGIAVFYLAVAEHLHAYAEGKTIAADLIIAAVGLVAVWIIFRLGPFRENVWIAGTAFPVKLGVVALVLMLVGAWAINPKLVGPSLLTVSLLLARAHIGMPPSFSTSYVTSLAIDAMHHRIRLALSRTLPVFWYDEPPVAYNDPLTYPGKVLHSVSSTFLQPGGQGFSTPTYVAEIARGAVVVIMSQADAALFAGERGLKALGANRARWDQFDQATPGGDIKVWILKGVSRVTDLPPSGFTPAASGALVMARPGGVTIRTPDIRWFFGGDLPIPATLLQDDADASAQVHLRLHVRAGPIGVGVLNKHRAWIAQQALSAAGPVDIYLAIPRLADATDIIVYNGGVHSAGLVDVDAVGIATFK